MVSRPRHPSHNRTALPTRCAQTNVRPCAPKNSVLSSLAFFFGDPGKRRLHSHPHPPTHVTSSFKTTCSTRCLTDRRRFSLVLSRYRSLSQPSPRSFVVSSAPPQTPASSSPKPPSTTPSNRCLFPMCFLADYSEHHAMTCALLAFEPCP